MDESPFKMGLEQLGKAGRVLAARKGEDPRVILGEFQDTFTGVSFICADGTRPLDAIITRSSTLNTRVFRAGRAAASDSKIVFAASEKVRAMRAPSKGFTFVRCKVVTRMMLCVRQGSSTVEGAQPGGPTGGPTLGRGHTSTHSDACSVRVRHRVHTAQRAAVGEPGEQCPVQGAREKDRAHDHDWRSSRAPNTVAGGKGSTR
jgi:hypothetical protein